MNKFKPINTEQLYLLPPSIEDFIPPHHLARMIDEVVDTFDVSEIEVHYSHLGQKSYHPHLLLKLLFYGYAIGIRSGRKIAGACESDTAFMYLANMYRPDFRTLNDFRKNNIDFVQKAFVHIVKLCKQVGMAKAGMLIIDGTKLKANASGDKTKTKESLEQWNERIENDIQNILQQADQTDKEEDKLYGDNRGDELPTELTDKQKLRAKIQQALQQMKEEDKRINLTDNEAKFIRSKNGIDINYNCQTAISEDGIILNAYTCNDASDRTQTITIIKQTEQLLEEQYEEILADSGYASYDNLEKLEHLRKIVYMPDQQMLIEQKQAALNPYHKNNFLYNELHNHYRCPQNKILTYQNHSYRLKEKQQSGIYKSKECKNCEVQPQCVTKGIYRTIQKEDREHLRQQVRDRLQTKEGKQRYLKRMRIESVFGHLKNNLKYINLQLRGIKKTTAEWQLMCIGYNLTKLYKRKLQLI